MLVNPSYIQNEQVLKMQYYLTTSLIQIVYFLSTEETPSRYCMNLSSYEPGHEKMYLMSDANNKGADQPAHLRSLISAFDVRCSDSIISLDSIAEISRL